MSHRLFFLLFSLSLALPLQAQMQVVDVPVSANDILIIKGLDIQVSFVKASGNSLKILGLDNNSTPGSYRAERRGNQIVVLMNEYDSKRDWKNALSQKPRKKVIEVRGPAIPVEVHARDGQLTFVQWANKAEVHLINGKILSNQSRDLNLTLQKGEVTTNDLQGSLKVKATQAQMTFKNSNADADIQIQSGQLSSEKGKGNWNITSQNATVKILQSQGVLEVQNQKGLWTVSKFKGRVDGQMQDGNINMSVLEDSEVNLKSNSGKIQIQVPQGAGSYLNLLSAEGDLFLPGDLKANRGGTEKSYRGRLRGESQKLSVTARSQEGLIILKY